MSSETTGHRRPTKPKKAAHGHKRKREDVDVEKLQQGVDNLDPKDPPATYASLPLSAATQAGLRASHFAKLTEIQRRAIPLALRGHDILGAARTGSGKTLAFVVPVLENLHRESLVGADAGLAAMIVAPTRELAIQIFDVLRAVGGRGHMFAAGLVIGGKSAAEEAAALARMNIVVCTPGRMLHHLSETPLFSLDNLRMLVLDEADRILDMGFSKEIDAIVAYLPRDRQTLLFSATQTRRVADLARLSLKDPAYVSVHEDARTSTPAGLTQTYTVTELPSKLDTLYSFIASAKKAKVLVFMSSGKQVRFVYETFRRLQPGVPLLHLHGRQKQTARLDIVGRFSSASHACLFATDVAARGLDFPAVDWVVQLDAPEDADTYIHRVGRTARYERTGRAALFLDPSEEEHFIARLAAKKVPIEKVNVKQKKQTSIQPQISNFCFQDPSVKYLGQKAFASYVRSLHLQKDKEVFGVERYDLAGFARSLGLPGAPRIRFTTGDGEKQKEHKNRRRRVDDDQSAEDASGADDRVGVAGKGKEKVRTKYDKMFERKNQDVLADHYGRMIDGEHSDKHKNGLFDGSSDDEDEPLYTTRTAFRPSKSPSPARSEGDEAGQSDKPTAQSLIVDSNRRKRAMSSRKKTAKLLGDLSERLVFDEDTQTMVPAQPLFGDEDPFKDRDESKIARDAFVDAELSRMRDRDVVDKEKDRARRKEKKLKKKMRERQAQRDDEADGSDGAEGGAQLEVIDRPFEDIADLYESGSDDEDDHGRGPKKMKRDGTSLAEDDENRLEDLESMAAKLLD